MTETLAIKLDTRSADFVQSEIEMGHYANADELVGAALDLLRENAMRLQALHAAIAEGEASGAPQPFDFDEFILECRAQYPSRG